MECYKVLDVDENATMEEIKEAYENKVKQFREEIKDERRAKKFIEVFDKAYEEIKLERENTQNQQTMIMNINDTALKNYQKNDFDKVEERNYVFRRDEIDEEEGNFIITKEKRKSYSKKSSSKNKKNSKKASENKDKDRSKEKSKNEYGRQGLCRDQYHHHDPCLHCNCISSVLRASGICYRPGCCKLR